MNLPTIYPGIFRSAVEGWGITGLLIFGRDFRPVSRPCGNDLARVCFQKVLLGFHFSFHSFEILIFVEKI